MDNDGWPDIFICNGHVYPEVDGTSIDAPYAQHKYLYRNLRNGQFEEVTAQGGPGINTPAPGRGCAFGDYDNDGVLDVVVNCVNSLPQLLHCDSTTGRNWIKIRTVGTKSNRTGIGAKISVTTSTPGGAKPFIQIDEVRSGGSYYSQNDLRIHFGLDHSAKADSVEIKWPSGTTDKLTDLAANHLYVIQEGGKILRTAAMGASIPATATPPTPPPATTKQ
jgi:enediyne biosynthesis protein E4